MADIEKAAAAEENGGGDDYVPIRQVELTVPKTDDMTVPVYTFRMWFLGVVACVLLSFVNQFFWYRKEPLSISSIAAQVAVVPIGHLMARALPTRVFLAGTRVAFTLNPGPFNMKEHVCITMLANAGAGGVYASHVLSAVRLFYKKSFGFVPALILMMTTQLLGYGWAGIFRTYLVEPAEMWWPGNLVQVSLFRALHEKEKRPRGRVTRTQFFMMAMAASFAYYIFPGYLFTILSSISWVCWLAPNSVTAHQIGSGLSGLGLGAFGLDWSTVASYLGSPLASPWFASANMAVGFLLFTYLVVPLGYWTDLYHAKTFPIYSRDFYYHNGAQYNTTLIIHNFHLDKLAYDRYGQLYLSIMFAFAYGIGFATLPATLVHVLLFNGKDLWRQTRAAMFSGERRLDVHARLMRKYKQVPTWWFWVILLANVALILFAVEYYKTLLQLPWWGVFLACAIAFLFTLPIGIISATTNQGPGLNVITEYILGYAYPGYPVANMCFKVYGYISMSQALSFIADFKLGHYMKIPPRAMFNVQIVGTVISVVIYTCTAWWLMESIPHLCDRALLPKGSQWTCPSDHVFYDASVIWGLVGPQRIFGNLGVYANLNWFFLGGAAAPVAVWAASRAFPGHKWIPLVHAPILLSAMGMLPPASSVNFTSWIAVAFVFGYVVYRRRPDWWGRYNYVLSGALDAGTAFSSVAMFFALRGAAQPRWWGNSDSGDGCPLASCPVAKGIVVDGCPVY